MNTVWCWRCKQALPMLDDDEWAVVWAASRFRWPWVAYAYLLRQAVRRGLRHPRRPAWRLLWRKDLRERYRYPLRAGYEMFTGLHETYAEAIYHHVASLYGPLCVDCGKPLRTPQARLCAFCGWGMDALDAAVDARAAEAS